MSAQKEYAIQLLRVLEATLQMEGHRTESIMVSQILHRLSITPDLTVAFDELYAVNGFSEFVIRLLWYVEKTADPGAAAPDVRLIEYQARQLMADLPSLNAAKPAAPGESGAHTQRGSVDYEQSLRVFSGRLHQLKREAYDGDRFIGLSRARLEEIAGDAERLNGASDAEGHIDVMKFAAAFTRFARYIADHQLLSDVRVMNFIEHTHLTLQTVLSTQGADDFDSLHQTTELLEQPQTLFDVTPTTKE